MNWHTRPKDDAWRCVTPSSVHVLGCRLWLRCDAFGHTLMVPAIEWCESRQVSPTTPLLLIARRLRCINCGECKAHCWPEPHDCSPNRTPTIPDWDRPASARASGTRVEPDE